MLAPVNSDVISTVEAVPRNCPVCDSELTLIDVTTSGNSWRKTVFQVFGFKIHLLALEVTVALICFGLGALFGTVWFVIGAIVVVFLAIEQFFAPVHSVVTYKCKGCGKFHSISTDEWRDITNRSSSFRRCALPPDPKRLRPFGPLNSNVMFAAQESWT